MTRLLTGNCGNGGDFPVFSLPSVMGLLLFHPFAAKEHAKTPVELNLAPKSSSYHTSQTRECGLARFRWILFSSSF